MRKLIITLIILISVTTAAIIPCFAASQEQWEVNKNEIEAYFEQLINIDNENVIWQVGSFEGSARAQHKVRTYGTVGNIQKMHTITLKPETAAMADKETLLGIQTHEYLHRFSSNEALTEFTTWLVCMEMNRQYIGAFNHIEGMTYVYDADKYYNAFIASGLSSKDAILLFVEGSLESTLMTYESGAAYQSRIQQAQH